MRRKQKQGGGGGHPVPEGFPDEVGRSKLVGRTRGIKARS